MRGTEMAFMAGRRHLPRIVRVCLLAVRRRMRDRVHAYHEIQRQLISRLELQIEAIGCSYRQKSMELENARMHNRELLHVNTVLREQLESMRGDDK